MCLFCRKTSLKDSGILRGFTDWHCHLLPGVDDGVRTVDETLQTLALYEKEGVSEVWLTPHIMEDIPNSTASLKEKFAQLLHIYKGNIRLHLAAEYMLDKLFLERLSAGDLLPLGADGDRLLVETSYFNPPMDFAGILMRIKQAGFHPVLAHPERYRYMGANDYMNLKAGGILLQFNLFSVTGAYGKTAMEKARFIAGRGLYDISGTDTHRLAQFVGCTEKRIAKRQIEEIFTQFNYNISR